ncbi:sensor domain-containing protein [Subtercola boreus]|uniref:sensor domain-containing protein n=1 Tax=Subtercola boreus TaxID=120213 RepID=UPI001558C443|nr:EAL domain-containing protein [Subtercola boreus]
MNAPDLDYEALFLGSPAGTIVTDGEGTIVAVNDGFLLWTGWQREALVGTPFRALLPIGDRILFSTRTAAQLDLSGQVPYTVMTIFGPDRQPIAAAMMASRVKTDPPLSMFTMGQRRQQSAEQTQLISAVRHAEAAIVRSKEAEQGLEQLARHDSLTGLLNRDGFLADLTDLVSASGPNDDLAVCQLGLDHFRAINESLGTGAGDVILRTAADRLRHLHPDALMARVGEDSFAVAVPRASQGPGFEDDLLASVAEPLTVEGLEIVITASLGVDVLDAPTVSGGESPTWPSEQAGSLLRNAGTAMYNAKSAGRNRWRRFTTNGASSAIDEIRLLGEIRAGIAKREFRLDYQPQLNLATGRPLGVEALIRWDHPHHGTIAPGRFIDIAERSGLISHLGAWVCETAIAHCAHLNEDPTHGPFTMSVNVSARQFSDSDFAGSVAAMLRIQKLDPALLTVELTETALITDTEQALTTVRALKELGVRLSIDDFGTGHAGFAYLRDFPIDEIKIDRSYIAQLDVTAEDTAIVVSCIELAHAVGIVVVAEGVETAEQLARLTDLGCDYVQGFYYARPLNEGMLETWLSSHRAGG